MRRYELGILLFCGWLVLGACPSRTKTYTAGNVIQPAEVTENEDNVFNYLCTGVDTYADATIATADLQDASVTTAKINTGAVTTTSIADGTITTTDIADNTITATDLAATQTFADGDYLDMSAINPNGATEGLRVPQATSCTSATADGQLCWDSDSDVLYAGNDTSARHVGRPIWSTTNSVSLTLTDTGDVAFTDLDLTTATSSTARIVILQVTFNSDTAGEYSTVSLRRNGDTPTSPIYVASSDGDAAAGVDMGFVVIVGMDTNQVIEYAVDVEATSTVDVQVSVLGYW